MDQKNTPLGLLIRQAIDYYKYLLMCFLKGLKKYWGYSVLLFVIFSFIFILKYTKTQTYSTVKLGYVFNSINKKYYGDLLFDLDQLVDLKEYNKLGDLLNIDTKLASNIVSLKAKNIVNSKLHEDFTEGKIPFYVHLKVVKNGSITKLQTAITLYLQRDEFSNAQILTQHQSWTANINKLKNELITINNLILPDAKYLLPLLQLKNEKITQLIQLERNLKNNNNVNLLNQFEAFQVSKKSQLSSFTIKLSLLFLFSIFITSIFIFWYKDEK